LRNFFWNIFFDICFWKFVMTPFFAKSFLELFFRIFFWNFSGIFLEIYNDAVFLEFIFGNFFWKFFLEYFFPRPSNDTKFAVQKNHLGGQILSRSLNPSKNDLKFLKFKFRKLKLITKLYENL